VSYVVEVIGVEEKTMQYLVCPECATKNLPGRAYCLGCGKSLEGVEASSVPTEVEEASQETVLKCLRCAGDMQNAGVRSLHEKWDRIGIWEELTELFVGRTNLRMYVCLQCGHVEFFLEGVGEDAQNRLDKAQGQR
jgi:DNA-directed RNA polymerase subunit RPC12/RpoP